MLLYNSQSIINSAGYSSLIELYKPEPTATFGLLVYGPSGSGKTHLAGTFPNPFFIDADQGMRSLEGEYPRLPLRNAARPFATIVSILADAKSKSGDWAEGKPYGSIKTIVIDSITSLVDDYLYPEVMVEAKRSFVDEKLSYDEYGKVKSRLATIHSLLKDLTQSYFIIETALVDEEKDENSGELTGKPSLTGKYRNKIMADFDETYFSLATTPIGKPTIYRIYTAPYKWFQAKSRLTQGKPIDDPSYEKIKENFRIPS